MFNIELNINVQPKQRVRGAGGIFYTAKETRDCETLLGYKFKEYMYDKIAILKGFDIRITKLHIYTTSNRGDIDNYIKLVLDSANKFLWYDDRQIVEMNNILLKRKCEYPKLILEFEPMEKMLGL